MDPRALESYVESMLALAAEKLTRFAANFAQDSSLALDATDDTFEAAGTVHVFKRVRHLLRSGSTVEQVIEEAQREALGHARWPRRSTSVTSNLIHQCIGAAWGEVAAWGSTP